MKEPQAIVGIDPLYFVINRYNRKEEKMTDKLYTIKEVAEMLKVNKMTVYQWIYKGKIQSVKVMGVVRIKGEEIERLVK